MENKNNNDWNVNLNYITKDDLKTIYGFIPDADQTTTDNTKTDLTVMAIAISSERINTITGNQIEVIEFKNLNETQQQLVKRATARMTIYYLTDGMAFIRSSVSISGNGLSSSISPPSEPDYVLMEVYNLLQQANLHTPRKAINNPISCNTDNFNTPNIFDESDTRVITWDSGNKTFLRKEGLIAGTGIKIDDISDTIPKLKIHVDSNIDSLWEVNKDNPNFIKPKDYKGIDVNGKRIIDVGTPTFLSDATTKQYVDDLLDKKQNKLIAGENIKIDEKTNTISATGGSSESLWEVDPNSPNIIQPKEKRIITSNNTRIVDIADPTQPQDGVNLRTLDKKLEDKIDKDQFKYAFGINTIGTEIPNLETTNKTVGGAINENKMNIDKKQDKENWKIIGKSTSNREYGDFKLNFNKLYRTIITWEKPPFNQVNIKIKVEFKTGKYLGGNPGDKIFLTKGEIEGVEANLYLIVVKGNNWKLIINGGNKEYANIFSLEELQDTIKIDIQPKLQIRSGSLTTNEIEENIWDIELKNNPTPSPSGSNWKEVGTREKNQWDNWQITYNFIVNKRYRVYYSWNIYNPVFAIQEFIITDNKIAGVEIEVFNNNSNVLVLSVNHAKFITIYSLKGNDKGNTWKLEELQE